MLFVCLLLIEEVFYRQRKQNLNKQTKIMKNSELKKELLKMSKVSRQGHFKDEVFFQDGKMWATDYTNTYIVPVDFTGYGKFDCKKIKKLLSKLPGNNEVTITGDDDNLRIDTSLGTFKMPGSEYDTYPAIPDTDNMQPFIEDFQGMDKLETAAKFVTKNELRHAMTFIYFGNKRYKGIAATDAHKLYFEPIERDLPEAELLINPVVPYLFKNRVISIFYNDDLIKIVVDGIEFIQTRDGSIYPNIRGVLPTEFSGSFEVPKDELIKKLEFALLAASECTHLVVFDLSDKIFLRSECLDYETSYQSEISGNKDSDMIIAFNGNFLSDVLKECGDTVRFELQSPNRATVINNKFLLMPILSR